MHEVASYVVSFFLSPFNWIIILVVAGYFLRRQNARRICKISALLVFLIFGNQLLLDLYAKWWQPAPVSLAKNSSFSCGIVPGGFASPDNNGDGYFNATSDRFIEAEKLFKLGIIKHILISGGNGKTDDKNFREGHWVKKQLTITGIPDSVIFVEDKSNNTSDNALYAKHILDSMNLARPYLLITSAQHMPRASLLFRNAGMTTVEYPCSYIAGRGRFSFSSIIPQPSVLLTWEVYFKETFGYLWYKIKK